WRRRDDRSSSRRGLPGPPGADPFPARGRPSRQMTTEPTTKRFGAHGGPYATVCARFGLECVVYMGAEDMRRQKPNVERMGLLGAQVVPVEFGTRTLKEATSEAIRDWITNVETTNYMIGSRVGPSPDPAHR